MVARGGRGGVRVRASGKIETHVDGEPALLNSLEEEVPNLLMRDVCAAQYVCSIWKKVAKRDLGLKVGG